MVDVFSSIFLFCCALFLVIVSSNWILDSLKDLGKSLKISPLVMGIIALGFGTSLPELFAALFSVQRELYDIPIPVVVGSNIMTLSLFFGFFSLFLLYTRTHISEQVVVKEKFHIIYFGLSTLFFLLFLLDGSIVFGEGLILFLIAAFYTGVVVFSQKTEEQEVLFDDGLTEEEKEILVAPFYILKNIIKFIISISIISVSAYFLVQSLEVLAISFNIHSGIVALLLLSFGTSVPELAIVINALKKGSGNYVIGNILGTCIFNIGIVVGFVSLFGTLVVDSVTYTFALPTLFVSSLLFFYAVASKRFSFLLGTSSLLVFVVFSLVIFVVGF